MKRGEKIRGETGQEIFLVTEIALYTIVYLQTTEKGRERNLG